MRGSVPLLLAMCAVYLLTTLGLGLFVSTISSTQQQAMMTTTFFFLMPMVYLSGFVFPIENMPVVDPVAHLRDSAALLPGDRAGDLPEGCGPRDVLAGSARADGVGRVDPGAGDRPLLEAPRLVLPEGLAPLGLPHTLSRAPLRRRASTSAKLRWTGRSRGSLRARSRRRSSCSARWLRELYSCLPIEKRSAVASDRNSQFEIVNCKFL